MTRTLGAKLKLKEGFRAAVIGAPPGYVKELGPLPAGAKIVTALGGELDWIQIFVKDQRALKAALPGVMKAIGAATLVWFSFPKGTSKIQTDLTRDKGWEALPFKELKWVTLVSVNDVWSAYCVRRYRGGEEKQSW